MTKSLDQLIDHLLDEIGASGPAGVSIPQLLGLVKTFYDGDQCVDHHLLAQVWKWLGRHPDISIGPARKFNQTPLQEFQVDPTDPLTAWKSRSPKVQASEERIYRSICGHSRQEAQLFPPEHALLMQIAASRANGILQGDLGRQTGQDKRSVPKRTDVLHSKGYILKQPVVNKGTKTSRLILPRYVRDLSDHTTTTAAAAAAATTPQLSVRDVIQQLGDRLSDGSPIELTKLVDVTGDRGDAAKKVLSRIVRALEKTGCLKRVRTAFGPSAHSSDLKTVVQQLRPLSEDDLSSFENGHIALHRPLVDLLSEEKNKAAEQAGKIPPQWNPNRLVVNQLQDLVQNGVPPGFDADARKALMGAFMQTAIFPTTPSESSLSGPNSLQTTTSSSHPPVSHILPSPALHPHLLSKQIQDVHAVDLLPHFEEPQIVTIDGQDIVQPIARANSPDPEGEADTSRRGRRRRRRDSKSKPKPKQEQIEQKAPTRTIEKNEEEMRPQGRPRRFVRGTEKFWQHHFWQAKLAQLAQLGDKSVPIKKGGIMHDPAGMALFESRPPDFDETLVQAIDAGLPIPATPDAIHSDWVHQTRAVLDRADDGAYVTPAGMYLGRSRHRSQLLIIRSSRLGLVNWHDRGETPAFRFMTSMAAHSFSCSRHGSAMEALEIKPARPPRSLKRTREEPEEPGREMTPGTVTRKVPRLQAFQEPTTVSPHVKTGSPQLMDNAESDAEHECPPEQAQSIKPLNRASRRRKPAKPALSPSPISMPGSELGRTSSSTPTANKPTQQTSLTDTNDPTTVQGGGPLENGSIPIDLVNDAERNSRSPDVVQDDTTRGPTGTREASAEYQPSLESAETPALHEAQDGEEINSEKPYDSDMSESERLILRKRQGRGGDSGICQDVLFELVELAQGAAPYNRTTLQKCMVARWQAKGGKGYRPLMKVIKSAAARLVESERVREHTFSFRGKGGVMIRRSILHFPTVDVTGARITELKERMIVADTTEYIPQEWAAEMLPPGQLVKRKPKVQKGAIAKPDGSEDDKSKPTPKRPKTHHDGSPSATRQSTPFSESMPIPTPVAPAFLTLKVPNLGTLPQVQEYNTLQIAKLSRERERAVRRQEGKSVAWAPHQSILPESLDDLLDREKKAEQGDEDATKSFFQQVDTVAKWEQREAESIFAANDDVPWRFLNHVISLEASCPSSAVRWFLVQFDQTTERCIDRECVEFPPWSVFKSLQPPPGPLDNHAAEQNAAAAAAQGRRLTRQSTGAIKKTKWLGIDDYVESEKTPGRNGGKKRRRRDTVGENMSQDSEWEGESRVVREGARARKKTRVTANNNSTSNSSKPPPKLKGKDLEFVLGVICVRSLLGGIEQTVDWSVLLRLCPPDLDKKRAQARWKHLLQRNREEVENLSQQFQDKYVTAFEQGEAPVVDFDNIDQIDWKSMVAWATTKLSPFPPPQTLAEPKLAGSRKEVLAEHHLDLQPARDFESVYEHGMTMNSSTKAQLYSSTIDGAPASASNLAESHVRGLAQLATARSYVLATVVASDLIFDAGSAEAKLLSLGKTSEESRSLLLRAVRRLQADKKIVKHVSDPPGPLGLRQWRAGNIFGDVLESRRLVNKLLLRTAAKYKIEVLDASFARGERVGMPKEGIVDDGIMLAILNLISQGQIAIRPGPDVPQSRYGIDWENAGYQTRLIERSKFIFTTMLEPTKAYPYGDPVKDSRRTRVPRGDCDEDNESNEDHDDNDGQQQQIPRPIPLWIDIHGNVLVEWWETALAAVLGLLNVRPGLSVDACAGMLNGMLTSNDVDLILQWSKDSGVAKQQQTSEPGRKEWETTAWWWLVLGEGVDWT